MQKTIGVLVILLAIQLSLAVGLNFTRPDLATVASDTPLLDLGDRMVDRLTIEDTDNSKLVLTRQGDGWVLPDKGDFPADEAKVDLLLDRLKGLQRGLAVATSEGAMRRFKVSDDAFERRVVLAQGDETLATLYFGTSPGMRRVHARTQHDDGVYVVEFGVHDAAVRSEDWEDKALLAIPSAEIETISLAGLTLKRLPGDGSDAATGQAGKQTSAEADWTVESLAEGESVNQVNAGALVGKLSGLRFASVLGSEAKAEYGLEQPELVIALTRKGEQLDYALGKRDKDQDYVLKVSHRDEYFRLPGHTGDALIKAAEREQLIVAASDTAGEDEALPEQLESMAAQGGQDTGGAGTGQK
jgi:hypothetical protein